MQPVPEKKEKKDILKMIKEVKLMKSKSEVIDPATLAQNPQMPQVEQDLIGEPDANTTPA